MTITNIIKDFFEGKVKLWKSYWLVGELLNGIVLLIIFNLEIYFFNTNSSVSQIPFLDFTNLTLISKIFIVIRIFKERSYFKIKSLLQMI